MSNLAKDYERNIESSGIFKDTLRPPMLDSGTLSITTSMLPRLGPFLSCGEVKLLDMEGSMGMCKECAPQTTAVHNDYGKLFNILVKALDQAQSGKGRERHAAGEPFEQQEICQNTRAVGYGYPLGQARKKARESLRLLKDLGPDAAIAECLGAINYLAAAILVMQEEGDA